MIGFLEELPLLGRVVTWVLGLLGIAGAETVLATVVALVVTVVLLLVLAVIPGWIAAVVIIYMMVAVGPRVLHRFASLPAFRNLVNTTAIALPVLVAWNTTHDWRLLATFSAGIGAAIGVVGAQDRLKELAEPATE